MNIAYAGPRPNISHKGIAFETYRPDKYIYFQDLFHLFGLIEKAQSERQPLIYTKPLSEVSSKEILSWIHTHHPKLEETVNLEINNYTKRLLAQEASITHYAGLSTQEKQIYHNNLTLMHNYRLQRAANKIFYWHMIESISDAVIKKELREFVFPFEPKLYHIVEALANHILVRKEPLRPNIILKENPNGHLLIYLILEKI